MTKKHDIMWLMSAKSTNEEVRKHINELDNLSVMSVFEQTAGRGQRGNTWTSEPGANLTFSILLKGGHLAAIPPSSQSIISEMTALSIVDFLVSQGISARIKWPNDIYVGEKKICGILIENSLSGDHISHSIIGIGLNINQRNFDVNIPNPTSMVLCSGNGDYDLRESLEDIMEIFERYYNRYFNLTGGHMKIRRLYHSQMWRKDVAAEFVDRRNGDTYGRRFSGIIRNLSEIGNLMVEDVRSGELCEFGFKEIEYVISL